MKSPLRRLTTLVLCTFATLLAQTARANDPEAVFQDARIVHNVTVNGQKGFRVHAKFVVKYGLHNPCKMIAYFHYETGAKLKTGDSRYSDTGGNVSVARSFSPDYDPAYYNDFQLFVPHSALNMARGNQYDLKFRLQLYDVAAKRFFGTSGWYHFHLKMP
jgi:hypothetical protein